MYQQFGSCEGDSGRSGVWSDGVGEVWCVELIRTRDGNGGERICEESLRRRGCRGKITHHVDQLNEGVLGQELEAAGPCVPRGSAGT